MLGAIAGDIIGRPYEMCNWKDTRFPLFSAHCQPTDDSVLTIATAWRLLQDDNDHLNINLWVNAYKYFARNWPSAGYGQMFMKWAFDEEIQPPYNAWSNGAPMRVSPVAYYSDSLLEVLRLAKESAEVTHSHPEGIQGAQAVAGAVFIARKQRNKDAIRDFITNEIGYNLDFDYNDLVENYSHDYSCKNSVPQAIYTFLISDNFEDAIRKAISIGGDSDTIASMCGAIAEPFYGGVPEIIKYQIINFFELEQYEKLRPIIIEFIEKYTDYKYFME